MLLSQYHRGRRTQQEVLVFGMIDTSRQPALGYMQKQDAPTSLPIIPRPILLLVPCYDPMELSSGKTKQDVIIGDKIQHTRLALWEDEIGRLQECKCYGLLTLLVREF